MADVHELPVDPLEQQPSKTCTCGGRSFRPESDVFDTWMTSSLTPQIVGGWQIGNDNQAAPLELYNQVFPFALRPQAHEIIRTWAFYTIVKSLYHFNRLPWTNVFISGWGIAGEGMGKISKSRGGGPLPPLEMIERHSADALRYWAASTGPGKDAVISEEKIQLGAKLLTKLWNVARFSQPFLLEFHPDQAQIENLPFTPGDRWILARAQALIQQVTTLYQVGEYAAAKSESENFFWRGLADNYLEMCKQRLYDPLHPQHTAAVYALYQVFLVVLKLFAPIMPFICEALYLELYAAVERRRQEPGANLSIHTSAWPKPDERLDDAAAVATGELLVEIASAVRRYKSEQNQPLGSEISRLQLASAAQYAQAIRDAEPDLMSITRARLIELVDELNPNYCQIYAASSLQAAVE